MRDQDVARRLLLAFGAHRFIVFGSLSTTTRYLLRDAGSDVIEHGFAINAASEADWSKEYLAKSCLVCLNLSDDALIAVLSNACFAHAHGVYLQHSAGSAIPSVQVLEQRAFLLGYRKHPAYHRLFGYAELEQPSHEIATLLEPVPATSGRLAMPRLFERRNLHMDMLRESGRHSEAHVVRYDWASKFIRPNDVVLDTACGSGYGTYIMRRLSMAGCLFGVDRDDWAIDYANAQFQCDDIRFVTGPLPDALGRFADASVDVIVSFETLERVDKPQALLGEFFRILRPGGRVIVSAANDWNNKTDRDPAPRHKHVYNYQRLAQELATDFLLEHLTRQIASGCKVLGARGEWAQRPRVLEPIAPADASSTEAEWWLAVAMKSPEAGRAIAYCETVHGRFEGTTHLVDFKEHYTNPWLVHAMVEMPFRLQCRNELARLAHQVTTNYPRGTPDHGAALAVLCYRALEELADDAHLQPLEMEIADCLALPGSNPHWRRWQVSLTYVRARLRLRRGDREGALADFKTVATANIASITPTLGTKVVDAAFWAGTLSWSVAEEAAAREWWRLGLTKAGGLLGCDWAEFFGNVETPFVFAMNDAVEMVDRATACAQALSLTHRRRGACEPMLYEIHQQTLRSALRQREEDLAAARAETAVFRDQVIRVREDLRRTSAEPPIPQSSAKKTCVFTSAALNYLPKVRLLFNSLRELHPEIELHLALSDILPDDIDLSNEPFDEIHPPTALGIADLQGWTFCHDIVELSTAIKPFLLHKLLGRADVGRVLYFDPDMVLFSRVDDLLLELDHANVVLTPHQVEPEVQLRAVIDNEICSLKHGIYNLGFIGVSATDEGKRFAEWWKLRVYHFCRADIPNGLFTDQRWIDLVPAFFSGVAILRSPRHNVAPWNLTTRYISGDFVQGFKVNGEPLAFYHFTGFDSGAHRTMATLNGRASSQVHLLIKWYESETRLHASDPLAAISWAYGRYSNGEAIQPLHRLIYRERGDLQRAFPEPFDASRGGFYAWLKSEAPRQYPGIEGGPPGNALQQLRQQLTAGFAPRGQKSLPARRVDWHRVRCITADAINSPGGASRYIKHAWAILRHEGLGGLKRRLM